MRRAIVRSERQQRRYRRWQDLIAGAPSIPAVSEQAVEVGPGVEDDAPARADDHARE